jgi:hypothetical protein
MGVPVEIDLFKKDKFLFGQFDRAYRHELSPEARRLYTQLVHGAMKRKRFIAYLLQRKIASAGL